MYGAATIIPSVVGYELRVIALVRIHPHHLVAEPGQPLHRCGQQAPGHHDRGHPSR